MRKYFYFFGFVFFLFCCQRKEITTKSTFAVDFSRVDTPPVFKQCKKTTVLNKEACFRKVIITCFNNEFNKLNLNLKNCLKQEFIVELRFQKNKEILYFLEQEEMLNLLQKKAIEKAIQNSIKNLQVDYPATKQGIPVTTVYSLPIHIE